MHYFKVFWIRGFIIYSRWPELPWSESCSLTFGEFFLTCMQKATATAVVLLLSIMQLFNFIWNFDFGGNFLHKHVILSFEANLPRFTKSASVHQVTFCVHMRNITWLRIRIKIKSILLIHIISNASSSFDLFLLPIAIVLYVCHRIIL